MKDYQRDFFNFAIDSGALRFGEFTLKSGRVSPYFFNTGKFSDGASAAKLGSYYAAVLNERVKSHFMLFGPAYKGIPLATATAVALANEHDRSVDFSFNRKEIKDHGEGGMTVGAPLEGLVVIIDDVVSSGLSVAESVEIIQRAGATPAAVVITLDRQERMIDENRSATDAISERFGFPVHPIADLQTLITFLESSGGYTEEVSRIKAYRDEYGA